LFAGTETGVYCSLSDGQNWTRMGGSLPVAPVYDLKIKETDLVAGTHGRSFWILDDITPLRCLIDDSPGCRVFEPRTTVRTKLHFGALRSLRPVGVAHALAPGVGAGIRTFRKPDGSSAREYLDVGENPPNGAIVYYWPHLKSPDEARPPGRRQIPTIVSVDDPRSGSSWRGSALAKFLGALRIHSRPPCMGGYLNSLPQRLGQL